MSGLARHLSHTLSCFLTYLLYELLEYDGHHRIQDPISPKLKQTL